MTNTHNLLFRPACHDDIPVLCQLLDALFTLESDFQPDPDKQARALQMLIDKAGTSSDRPAAVVWLAEQDARVIGMCSLQVLISTAEGGEVGLIEDVIVAADHRRQGIGRQMLDSLEAWARDRGLTRLQLLADRHNQRAMRFYARQGWTRMQMLALRKTMPGA